MPILWQSRFIPRYHLSVRVAWTRLGCGRHHPRKVPSLTAALQSSPQCSPPCEAPPPPPKPHAERRRTKNTQVLRGDKTQSTSAAAEAQPHTTQVPVEDNIHTPSGDMVAAGPDTSVKTKAPTPAAAFYTVRAMAAEDSPDQRCQLEMHFWNWPATCARTRHCPLTQTGRTNLGTSHCAKTLVSGCLATIAHSSNVCGLEHPMKSCTSIFLLRIQTTFIGAQT